jgi:hypothetical protein
MSREPRPLPSGLGSAFRVSTARRAGASIGRMRATDLERPFWGVRTVRVHGEVREMRGSGGSQQAREVNALARIEAYAPRMSPLGFFSHLSAARLLGVPLPWTDGEPVHVSVLRPHRAPRGAGVRGHEIDGRLVSVRLIDGMRVASPASTWAQLGPALNLRDLVALGDAMVRIPRVPGGGRGDPTSALATVEELQGAISVGRRLGAAKLREALPLIRVGAASRPESHLRLELLDHGLPEPELDREVRNGAGCLLGISELAYPQWKVAVEYEGDHHRSSAAQWNRDIEKYEHYASEGWAVVRITAEHLYGDRPRAADRVRAVLLERGWRG